MDLDFSWEVECDSYALSLDGSDTDNAYRVLWVADDDFFAFSSCDYQHPMLHTFVSLRWLFFVVEVYHRVGGLPREMLQLVECAVITDGGRSSEWVKGGFLGRECGFWDGISCSGIVIPRLRRR